MYKGFMMGVVVGATVTTVYCVGVRAKEAVCDSKQKIKDKLDEILK